MARCSCIILESPTKDGKLGLQNQPKEIFVKRHIAACSLSLKHSTPFMYFCRQQLKLRRTQLFKDRCSSTASPFIFLPPAAQAPPHAEPTSPILISSDKDHEKDSKKLMNTENGTRLITYG
ncbi:hypothetical protein Ahy_B03g063490 isoform D [Arachis hypogaea]|uniref:Uncharacterized protein n=1 Tax=Arachis hypogaea TaxID=3818 RepID=A0A444ZXG7_ARAHY|nr:hypothetical protein Ahy_B03g063490 isoform D [Arachis hypogaea]